ncbi:alkaline phosphatase D family protein [uncultured Zobellia sp.]|uniref:alkaline phosphatase D family protein n=1 Tax=uncultured Zobellia sp. TaxID=255433 RepID=UPI0025988277|nr:alkaline phosphatase D family protein [uncultured Zobellia sp.]
MKRRDYIKTVSLGAIIPMAFSGYGMSSFFKKELGKNVPVQFKSAWELWYDMKWAGPGYWGNRLQDWEIRDGRLLCNITAKNRNLQLLTVQNHNGDAGVRTSVTIEVVNPEIQQLNKGCVGMLLGGKGDFEDYRSAIFGKGLVVGLTPTGKLKVGEAIIETGFEELPKHFTLSVSTSLGSNDSQNLQVEVLAENKTLFLSKDLVVQKMEVLGNFALMADFQGKGLTEDRPSCAFSDWTIQSSSLYENEGQIFGPICFTQYTLHRRRLKLKGQFAPFEKIPGHKLRLEFKKEGGWAVEKEISLTHAGRTELFVIDNWEGDKDVPYRIAVKLPRKDGVLQYYYEGTIAEEPKDKDELKLAVLNCNADYGFPDSDIHEALSKLDYDICAFLGDQFYERNGGYGSQFTGDFDKRCLDFLRKWMMFGWSYREVFRHKPCAVITDDHDVYQGNLWGAGGSHTDPSLGYGSDAQDTGGYKMDPEWVNILQFTQTAHLPDPYDARPVEQGINVYYTQWDYAGLSFAILEDRKFKSAPKMVLPPEAEVYNGFIVGENFDIKKHRNIEADLLGERQEAFLEDWVQDWQEDTQMKALLSQTIFAAVATLPKDNNTGETMVPTLYVTEKGEYIEGDVMTVDADSNAWPQNKRDKALKTIRKAMTFHIAGDQHLSTFIKYGVDEFGDCGYAYTGPALNNVWPRRFWPPVDGSGHSHVKPAYTGDHIDGFGNKITVEAVGNPYNSHREPIILHNRVCGYGIVSFNKKERTIRTDCYKRFYDPLQNDAQYPGWPITVKQEDNYLAKADLFLPELHITSEKLPLLRVFEEDGTLLYVLRLPSNTYSPRVFAKGKYSISLEIIGSPSLRKQYKVKAGREPLKHLKINMTV